MSFLSDMLIRIRRTKTDAVIHLLKMVRAAETVSTLADLVGSTRQRSKERSDLDSQGDAPESV